MVKRLITWLSLFLVIALAVTTLPALGKPLPADPGQLPAVTRALTWLRTQQNADGGFPGFNAGATLDVLIALAAANQDARSWSSPTGQTVFDYLATALPAYATQSASAAAKGVIALANNNIDPCTFAGENLVNRVYSFYDADSGQFGSNNWDQAFSLLALSLVGDPIPPTATLRLLSSQGGDGGWGFTPSDSSEVDSTSLALQALHAVGVPLTHTQVISAVAFLHTQQNSDGAFLAFGSSSSASTATGIQGLIAAGENPLSAAWSMTGTTPLAALLATQAPEGGFPGYSGANDLYTTAQVLPALMGKTLPGHSRLLGARRALAWLRTQQNTDGSFPGFNPTGTSADAVLAIVAAGQDPYEWRHGGPSVVEYLAGAANGYAINAARTGKLIVTVAALKGEPESFGGVNLVHRLNSFYNAITGVYGSTPTDQAWALLALQALRQPAPSPALAWLKNQQNSDGGWAWASGEASDTNSTALVLQALAAAGESADSPTITTALDYLHTQQNTDGGFPYVKPSPWSTASDSNSTAYVMQGLTAVGENPLAPAWTTSLTETTAITISLLTPVDALLSFQNTTGGFAYQAGLPDDVGATIQAIPALYGKLLVSRQRDFILYLPVIWR